MTKQALVAQVKALFEGAFNNDPEGAVETAEVVTGSEVWIWDDLTVPQLRTLQGALFGTAFMPLP